MSVKCSLLFSLKSKARLLFPYQLFSAISNSPYVFVFSLKRVADGFSTRESSCLMCIKNELENKWNKLIKKGCSCFFFFFLTDNHMDRYQYVTQELGITAVGLGTHNLVEEHRPQSRLYENCCMSHLWCKVLLLREIWGKYGEECHCTREKAIKK